MERTNVTDIRLVRLLAANRKLSELRQRRRLAEMALEDALERLVEYQAKEEAMVNEIKRLEAGLNDGDSRNADGNE